MTRAGLARLSAAFVASVCLSGLVASAQGGGQYSAALVPDQEVPSVSSEANGTITLDIDEGDQEDRRTSSRTRGSRSAVAQAHIHFAQSGRERRHRAVALPGNGAPAPALGIDPPTARRAAPSAASFVQRTCWYG